MVLFVYCKLKHLLNLWDYIYLCYNHTLHLIYSGFYDGFVQKAVYGKTELYHMELSSKNHLSTWQKLSDLLTVEAFYSVSWITTVFAINITRFFQLGK